jgi:sugar (pentulose or hexulose) kinase
VTGRGDEILLAAPNRDARAAGAGLRLAAEQGAELHAATGHWPLPIFTAARLIWLRESDPKALERATAVLSANEWLAEWLCGERATDPTQAGETLLLDLASRAWSDDRIAALELPREIFPQLAEPGTMLGRLRKEAADELGLAAGTPVAVGAADTQAGLLGCGALDPGAAAAIGGTTTPVQQVLDAPTVDSEQRVWTGLHVLPDSSTWATTQGDRKYHLLQVTVQGARVLPGLHTHHHDCLP